ncbi:hypothetical protein like AT2G28200 [Hibiscus trionum]|uniref:C2H2-type domain-containing protein n=1 Tax=Hibiscus trionum TaxID=183268 RepID=A0A9W7MBE2_HIBTR|nr:hypothetical protein like AT2G28200 [Hibiscus trionum]
MQAQEEFDHQALIIKGKRTKRQRSSSPFGVTVTSSSSSACGGDGGGGGVAEEYNSTSSPVTCGEIYKSTEEEEEDMANCLIMLAQSDGPKRMNIEEKLEMVAAMTNKAGAYAYECKTCNRSFPSFQALGGHRASHKKPKGSMPDEKKPLVEDADQFNRENPALVALQVSNKANCHGNKGTKIHECSICGSEFSSGQALGGHMRRHRAAATNQAAVSVDTHTTSHPIESNSGAGIKPRNILSLDLNLPAPEDDPRESKFQFGGPQQAIVFSTPALVDCHY